MLKKVRKYINKKNFMKLLLCIVLINVSFVLMQKCFPVLKVDKEAENVRQIILEQFKDKIPRCEDDNIFFIPKEAILKFSWHRTNKIELGVYKYVIKDSDDSLIVY